jgi:hypothetical protein
MLSGRSFYQRRPKRRDREKKEFQRLIEKTKAASVGAGLHQKPDRHRARVIAYLSILMVERVFRLGETTNY